MANRTSRAEPPKSGLTFDLQTRRIKEYSLTENEVDGLSSLNSMTNVFFNLCTVFLGATLGSITGLTSDGTSVVNQVVFWSSVVLFAAFCVVACIVYRRADNMKTVIKGVKRRRK